MPYLELTHNLKFPYYSGTASSTLTINKAIQTIAFDPVTNKSFGEAPFALSATASSGLPISYEIISGPASLNGNMLSLTGTGTVTVRATQTGDVNYEAAPSVPQSFCVFPAKPIISASGITLSSSIVSGNQWYLNGEAIPSATAATYQAAVAGNYTVSVQNPCGSSVTSDVFPVTVSATEPALAGQVVLYPNPATEQIILELPTGITLSQAKVLDLNGKTLALQEVSQHNKVIFPVRHLGKGLYLLEVQTNKGLVVKKFLVQ